MNIAIIGAGISGLSSAFGLCKKGYSITIFAEHFSPDTTSNKAAAFWFPYHIRNDKRGIIWCRETYTFYKDLCSNEATGISMHRLVKMIDDINTADNTWMDFMPAGSYRSLAKDELLPPYLMGYEMTVPLIETQLFMPWLMQQLSEQNVKFNQQKITAFTELYEYDYIINCAGLGAKELCNDDLVYPARGQVALIAPQKHLPIFIDNGPPLYLVPRKDATILGGTMELNEWDATTNPSTLKQIHQRLSTLFPSIKDEEILGSWAGLRPCRSEVRLERENNIIHNYGHGGSGYTLAWGCAKRVAEMVQLKNIAVIQSV